MNTGTLPSQQRTRLGHYIQVARPDLALRLVRDIGLSYVDARNDGAGGIRVDAPSGGGIG